MAARNPSGCTGRQAAAWHDAMEMGMVGQCLAPGVEHGQASNPGSEAARIGGKKRHGRARSPEQDRIDDGLVLERHRGNGDRQCEDDVEVGNWQQLGFAGRQPGLPCRTLAFWTMAIAAGVVGYPGCAAIIASLDMAAERLRSAGNNGAHHPLFDTAKVPGVGMAIGLAMSAQNICHLDGRAGRRQAHAGHGPLPGA